MAELAAPWYESGTFWTIAVGAIATIVGVALGAWLTNRYNNPKRKLQYAWLKNVSLLNTNQSATSTLRVTHNHTNLTHPRLIDVVIQNPGKKAITASSFHNGDSIKINLDANVIEVLETTTGPATAIAPPITVNDSVLEVAPCLLVGRQHVIYSVLVDGEANNPSLQSPLADIEPEETEYLSRENRPSAFSRIATASIVALVAILITTIVFGYNMLREEREALRLAEIDAWSTGKQYEDRWEKLCDDLRDVIPLTRKPDPVSVQRVVYAYCIPPTGKQ